VVAEAAAEPVECEVVQAGAEVAAQLGILVTLGKVGLRSTQKAQQARHLVVRRLGQQQAAGSTAGGSDTHLLQLPTNNQLQFARLTIMPKHQLS
jgi:hypothetical protein